jgi:hypothetical protein
MTDQNWLIAQRLGVLSLIVLSCAIHGCMSGANLSLIKSKPAPLVYQDDSAARFNDPEDTVFVEVRTAGISKPIENLAIHYFSLFPDGEAIHNGDTEEYSTVNGRNAYKVLFRPAYIRKRERIDAKEKQIPAGWKTATIEDPHTAKPVRIMYGPVIPRQKILYLVEGRKYVYYVFLRADGDAIEGAGRKFEDFVKNGIDYK